MAARETALTLTGERTLPGVAHENYWFRRHEAAYLAVAETCAGAGRLLEAGCGEGYGAALLQAATGAQVVAVDYDATTVGHVGRTYPTVSALRANLVALPLADASVDAVVSLQVVEHLWDQGAFVDECRRVLRPGGTLVLSTPNRVTFSPPGTPRNPFHTRELDADELVDLVAPRFEVVRRAGLHHGPRLTRWEQAHGDLARAQADGPPETWPAGLRSFVGSVKTDDFALSDADVDASRDLVLVAVRRDA